jgi:hypothetical protein
MAITVTHKFVSAIPDAGDTTIVQPSNWNDTHQLAGLGTMAEQNANAVAITGGTISGVTLPASNITGTLGVSNGGTGATTLTGYVYGNGTGAMTAATTIPNTSITGLGTASTKDAGVALGVATLDAGGKVPVSELPAAVLGALSYQGTWDASTNTPTLTSSVGTKGYYYVVSVAGNTNLNGITDWLVGDWAVFNGSVWQKVDNTESVTSVNGQVGAVVLTTTNIAEGTNLYYTDARARASVSAGTGISYNSTTGVITNSSPSLGGDVVGPSSATDNAIVRFDTTTGKLIQSSVVTMDDTGVIAGATLTSPKINEILDTNGNEILGLSPTASATDFLTVKNGIGVGVPLHLYADGTSTNIGLHIQPKGSGLVTISDGTDFNKGIRFRSSGSAASAITLLDAVATAGRVVTLPDATTTLVGRDTTDTLTNKSISGTTNTLSNIGNASLTNSAITINGTSTSLGGSISVGTVTSVTGTAPVVSSGGATPAISMDAANTTTNGYLTSTDWNTFNGKGSGSVTSVSGTGTINGLTLTGTVTTTGSLTLGGTLDLSSPPAIGGTTAAAITGTTITANTQFNGAGTGLTGTATSLSIGGNAATVTNGVYTTGSYADPTWITSLAGSKISGSIDGGTF